MQYVHMHAQFGTLSGAFRVFTSIISVQFVA